MLMKRATVTTKKGRVDPFLMTQIKLPIECTSNDNDANNHFVNFAITHRHCKHPEKGVPAKQ